MTKMRAVFFLLLPLVAADYYKETQDFQYSRTGDDGEKKGFYGSQSGNMGGNYELSHNMDHLAKHQMTNLQHQVGDQLGIDPLAIGSGHNANAMSSGSLFGSASASGRAVHKGSIDSVGGGSSSRTGSYTGAHGGLASGSRTSSLSSNYDDYDANQRYNAFDANQRESSRHQSATYGENQQSGSQYRTGNKYVASTGNTYGVDRDLGERYSSSGRNQHNIHGSETYRTGSSQQNYGAASSGHHSSYSGSQNAETRDTETVVPLGTTIIRPVPVRTIVQTVPVRTVSQTVPLGSTLQLVVRPGQVVPIRVPIQTNVGSSMNSGYAQGSSYDKSDSQRRVDSHRVENQAASAASAVHGSHLNTNDERASGTKGFESSYSYKKEWENHGSTVNQPILRPVVYTNENTENVRDKVSSSHADSAQSSRSHDSSRTTYGTNYHAGRQNVAQSRDSKNTYVNWDEDLNNQRASSNSDKAGRGFQQSEYSYNKEWESHGTPTIVVQPKGESSTLDLSRDRTRTSDRLYDSQHASRTDESSSASQASSSQRQNYDRSQTYGAHSTNQQAYDESGRNSHANIDTTHGSATQPKAFQSSYSYHKAWEKHGTPYVIYPAQGAALTEDLNAHGSSASAMDAQNHGSSWSTSTGQKSGSFSSSNSNYGGSKTNSHYGGTEALSTDMERLQQQLRNKMSEMCTNCDTDSNTKTKGYSSSYSYSSQRSFGGAQDEHNVHRRKRKVNRNELSELDEYDNISVKNRVADYERWREDIEELRRRIQKLKKQITYDDTVVPNRKKTGYNKSEIKGEVELNSREHTETEEEIRELTDIRGKIESLRQKIQKLAHPQTDENRLKSDIETISKKVSDFDSTINNKRRIPRNTNYEFLGQETEDLGQQTQGFGQLIDLGQQTEDLGQQTEDLHTGSFYLGQQTQDLHTGSYTDQQSEDLGQQSEDLHTGSFYLGQQTQNLHTGSYAGQQTEDLGQQTEDLHTGSFHLGQETQDLHTGSYAGQQTGSFHVGQETQGSRNGKKFESTDNLGLSHNTNNGRTRESPITTNNWQSQSGNSRDHSTGSHSNGHHDTSEKDKIELDHIQLLQQSLNNPDLPIYGMTNEKNNNDQSFSHNNKAEERNHLNVHHSESPTQFRPRPQSHSQTWTSQSQLQSQSQSHSQSQSQSHSQSHLQSGQQTMDWGDVDVGQQFDKSHLQLQDNSGHRLSFAQETEDFGQQLEQTEDLKLDYEGQAVEKENVQQVLVEPIRHGDAELIPKFPQKQDTILVTSTEKPGFWKRVGNKATTWFG